MSAPTCKFSDRSEGGAVAIIAPAPPPYGGMALQAAALAERLAVEGIPVVMIRTNPPLPWPLSNVQGVRTLLQSGIYFLRLLRALPRAQVIHVLAASYFYFFSRVAPAVLLGRFFGCRVVVNYRGGEAPRFFRVFGRLLRPILRTASVITVPSTFLQRTFLEHRIAASIVPNLIDLTRFRYRHRARLTPHFLATRNLETMYNIKMALRAYEIVLRSYPTARLDVIGGGSQESALREWTKKRGLRGVVFHGAVGHERVPEFLDQADILLNPTHVDNFPLSLIEAFACGLAVVTTDAGGIPDLLDESGAALVVKPDDAENMAREAMKLLADDALAERTIAAGRRLAEKYDWNAVRIPLLRAYYPDAAFAAGVRGMEIGRS